MMHQRESTPAKIVVGLCFAMLVACLTAYAHHNTDSEFDISKEVTFTGRITAIEWTNPHVFLFVEVADGNGEIHEWHVEGDNPNQLKTLGWNAQMLQALIKARDAVVVVGYLSRRNLPHGFQEALVKEIRLPDGRTLPFQRTSR